MYPRVVRFLLGSVSEYALGKAPCSVLIARSRRRITKARVPRIILATDFSRDAEAAATWLRKLELPRASQITVVHVEELAEEVIARFVARGRLDLHQALIQAMGTRWQELARRLEERGKRFTRRGWKVQPLLLKGNPAEQILKLATKQQADLLVLGSRGVSGLKAILLGSVSHKVVQHASCSVMVVKGTRR
jgi:nucleotide-binding universal stress UspA family protein